MRGETLAFVTRFIIGLAIGAAIIVAVNRFTDNPWVRALILAAVLVAVQLRSRWWPSRSGRQR